MNFHRPCGFAEVEVNERGKRRRRYPVDEYRTPYEKLQMLPDWQERLKKGLSEEWLAQRASAMTDTESARRMQQARDQLLTRSRALWNGLGSIHN